MTHSVIPYKHQMNPAMDIPVSIILYTHDWRNDYDRENQEQMLLITISNKEETTMTIICNVTGKERKRLAQVLEELTNSKSKYVGPPTYAFNVGDYVIDRNGSIICPVDITLETTREITDRLHGEGFSTVVVDASSDEPADEAESTEETEDIPEEMPEAAEGAETPDVAPEAESAAQPEDEAETPGNGQETPHVGEDEPPEETEATEEENTAEDDDTRLTVSIPRKCLSDDALDRLRLIVENKATLFKRALQTDDLPIAANEETIDFPWFTLSGVEGEAAAYAQFITHLCKMAKEQSRVLDKPYDGDNDRFAMRIFMVRLDMKGAEFALARKLMMQHLTGNSGWRNGTPAKIAEKQAASKEPDIPITATVSTGAVAVQKPDASDEEVTASDKIIPSEEPVESEVETV